MGVPAAFRAYGWPLETLRSFKYPGRLLTVVEYYWPSVIVNLHNLRKIWYHLSRILGGEGADPRITGRFYLVVVQASLIFGAETWVMTPRIGRLLGIFHHRVVRIIVGKQSRRHLDWILFYPSLEDTIQVVCLEEMTTKISSRQNTVAQYIATRPII